MIVYCKKIYGNWYGKQLNASYVSDLQYYNIEFSSINLQIHKDKFDKYFEIQHKRRIRIINEL